MIRKALTLYLLSSFFVPLNAMSWWKYQQSNEIVNGNIILVDKKYDLGGGIFEVPANCVLDFQGGSICNGTLKGNNTGLLHLTADCLLCSFAGSFQDIDAPASVFGLHPKGDGSVKKTPNQQDSFERLNTLLRCVSGIKLTFEPGYYGFGYGDFVPQGEGHSARLWYGYYPFYYYDYSNEYPLKRFEIVGNGAKFINVYSYFIGAWTKEKNGNMSLYSTWNTNDGGTVNRNHATVAGGFIFIRTDSQMNLILDGFSIDMNRELFKYGGYQFWTQNQCGIDLTTNGDISISHVTVKNNVTDGVMILCQKKADAAKAAIYPRNVEITHSRFENNVRVGLALSAGEKNIVDDCDFISNGRIYKINEYFKFESPYSDIDIEPIIDKPFATVLIQNCRFKETNRQSIVSSRRNIKNLIIKNCDAENTTPRIEYRTTKNSKGIDKLSVVPSMDLPVFLNANAVDCLSLENIDLTDVAFGSGCICYKPTADDVGKEGQYYVTTHPKKKATAKNIRIHSGSTYNPNEIAQRENKKDRIINLLSLAFSKYNFQYGSGEWKLVVPATTKYGYGAWEFENVQYDIKDGYGIYGAAAWNSADVHFKDLTINLMERRSTMPVFNLISSNGTNGGVSESSGVRIDRFVVNDPLNAFDKTIKEPKLSSKIVFR